MKKSNVKNVLFFVVMLTFFGFSIFEMYNKYVVHEDFVYFLSEEDVPEQFDFANYPR